MRSIFLRQTMVTLLALSVLNAACKKEEESKTSPPAVNSKAAAKPVAAPVQNQVSSVTPKSLDFTTRKDPFKAPVTAPKVPVRGVVPGGVTLPILSYEVNQFRLIGIVAGIRENRAMVVDPAGKPYVLKEGMHIGKNNGTITRISPTMVEVLEQYREDNGKIKSHHVRLVLPRKS